MQTNIAWYQHCYAQNPWYHETTRQIYSMNMTNFRRTLLILGVWGIAASAVAQQDSLDRSYAEELPRIAPLEPDATLEAFETHPDFRVELVAAEPLVHDPIAMAFDEKARLFVVEMRGYSEQRDEDVGAIRLLEDTDGDGKYDVSHPYVEGLAWPTAVACWDGGIFVAVPPEIRYYKDTDGDNRADVAEVVYTGFGLSNVQGLLNSFKWGLDNRFYGATSSSGARVRPGNAPDVLPLELRHRDFSFDPRTREIRAESGGGQHGLTFDTRGDRFVCHNSNHIMLIHYDDRFMARNPYLAPPAPNRSIAVDGPAAPVFRISPVEPWRIVRTRLRVKGLVPGPVEGGGTPAGYFTSATGITMYKGDAWPSEYVNQAIIGDVGSNLVHRKIVQPDGLTMTAKRGREGTEFIRSRDVWFRPAQFANGPDGNLYIADMYREVIEHPDSLPPIIKKHLDLTSGNDRGRIYRVVHTDGARRAMPDLSQKTTNELVGLLDHANGWHRETAARLLYQQNDPAAGKLLLQRLMQGGLSEAGAIQTLHSLETAGTDEQTVAALKAYLADPRPAVRRHAVRLTESHAKDADLASQLNRMEATETDLRVRYELAFALGNVKPSPERTKALVEIASSGLDDPWMPWALLSSTGKDTGAWLAQVVAHRNRGLDQKFIRTAATLAGSLSGPDQWDSLLAALEEHPDFSAQDALSPLLAGMKQAGRQRELDALLVRRPGIKTTLDAMIAKAQKTALETKAPADRRVDAVNTMLLSGFASQQDLYRDLLSSKAPAPVKEALLHGLRSYTDPGVAEVVLAGWKTYAPRVREAAVETFYSRDAWLGGLLDAVESGQVLAVHLDSTRKERLRSHTDAAIQARARKLFPDDDILRGEALVAAYQDVLELPGVASRGRQVYVENCSPCHRLGSTGYEVGPDLVAASQGGAAKILTNMLDPNREINPQYLQYTVETENWERITGIMAGETANALTIKRAHGVTDTILRQDVVSVHQETYTLMPEGWQDVLSKQNIADLLAFLTSLE
jgi:putative membrane-bound dehydrogenase-like protein